jgi:hypothetical protein
MGALAATTPSRAGVVTAGAAVAATDTVSKTVLGARGAFLQIINGNAASNVMTISDATETPTGAAAAALAPTVTNGTTKTFFLHPRMADATTGLITITNSVTATVTYILFPLR